MSPKLWLTVWTFLWLVLATLVQVFDPGNNISLAALVISNIYGAAYWVAPSGVKTNA